MMLTKGGITIDVSHPSDIARYKKLGYVEIKTREFAKSQQAEATAALGTGSQPVAPVEPVEPEAAPEPEVAPKKGKGKK
jgi:hypothetical protein